LFDFFRGKNFCAPNSDGLTRFDGLAGESSFTAEWRGDNL
jgi:hypothetical protein